MSVADQAMWEERGDASTKEMLPLMNSKNDNTRKDLCLLYSQRNKSAYPPTAKAMARYLLTKYPNKNILHQRDGKKRDKNGKKGSDSKPEDKNNNTTDTSGAHVGEVTTLEDSTAPTDGSSIGSHISEVAKHKSRPAWSIEDLLGAHPIDDAVWGRTDPSDVSIDTANSAEIMAGSHIREEQTFPFRTSDSHNLLYMTALVPRKDDLS